MAASHFTTWFLLLVAGAGFFLILGSALFVYLIVRHRRNPPRGFEVTAGGAPRVP